MSPEKNFSKALMKWSLIVDRPMPWKKERNPYFIWLSEIILQQTRVEQGWDYYLKFKQLFPTVEDLANASEDDVLSAWEGLGYYSRARNLHHSAKIIQHKYGGIFPTSYAEVLSLKGVGEYTAAAICSFAFNQAHAVVDGNVIRVMSRYFGIEASVEKAAGKKVYREKAGACLDKKSPGIYNQAIMDFGATVCKPKLPLCTDCTLKRKCYANTHDLVSSFPPKKRKIQKRNRYFLYQLVKSRSKYAVVKRKGNDIWKGLYELPKIELTAAAFDLAKEEPKHHFFHKQELSHQTIYALFQDSVASDKTYVNEETTWYGRKQLENLAFPRVVKHFLVERGILD